MVMNKQIAEISYGFDSPRKNRQTERPKNQLEQELLDWMDTATTKHTTDATKEDYEKLIQRLKQIDGISDRLPQEINSLALLCQDRGNFSYMGLFLSACYSLIDAQEIIFDVDTGDEKINYLGFFLPSGKILFVKSPVGWAGYNSEGDIVNFSEIESVNHPKGRVVNFGKMGFNNEWQCSLINYNRITSGAQAENLINFGKIERGVEGDTIVNLGDCESVYGHLLGINFGRAGNIDKSNKRGFSVNCGSVSGDIGNIVSGGGKIIAVKKPDGHIYGRAGSEMREKAVLLRHAKLEPYFEAIRQRFEAYKTADYPKCFEALQVLDVFRAEEFRRTVDHVDLSL